MNSHRRGPSHGEGVPVPREADQNNTVIKSRILSVAQDRLAVMNRGASESQPTQSPKSSDHQVHPEHDDEHPEREA